MIEISKLWIVNSIFRRKAARPLLAKTGIRKKELVCVLFLYSSYISIVECTLILTI
jgi:hypothetical protein